MTRRVNWNDPYDFLITRDTIFGNPFSHKLNTKAEYKVATKRESIDKFRDYFNSNKKLQEACKILKDKRIACQCPSGSYCHGDVYVDFLDSCDIIQKLNEL
jgi:hypothetical protein